MGRVGEEPAMWPLDLSHDYVGGREKKKGDDHTWVANSKCILLVDRAGRLASGYECVHIGSVISE